MADLEVIYVNDLHLRINCERSIAYELAEQFIFDVPNARHSPAFKNKMWDGKIRLFNLNTFQIYVGLLYKIVEFAKERDYSIEIDPRFNKKAFSLVEGHAFVDSLNLPTHLEKRDYQIESLVKMIREHRALLLSPTASGKSYMAYTLMRYYNANSTLIIVPSINLATQMEQDFISYGYEPSWIHKIYTGQDRQIKARVVITTWQSAYTMPKKWFSQFKVMIGDEAHLFKAKSLITIMGQLVDCPHKFGMTGSLDGTLTNQLVLEGLFGKSIQLTTTKELVDQGYLSEFKVKCIVLGYAQSFRKAHRNDEYKTELEFLLSQSDRNKFIRNLALSLKGNTLILTRRVDDHGKIIYDELVRHAKVPVHFVHGKIKGDVREEIRQEIINSNGSITIASFVFATGVNIPNLDNLIMVYPLKSRIKNLQSIGRLLRKSPDKKAEIFDLADDLSYGKKINITLRHFRERVLIYNEQKYDYKLYQVQLNEDRTLT